MRLKHIVALLGLGMLGAGCGPLKQVARIQICEPAMYCLGMDEAVACCRNQDLAEEAWYCFQNALPDCQYSDDFADGFKAGFAQYVYAGGNGEPPPVPPRAYWKPNYQSPEGQQLMLDWFRGYRHGAAVARESGYREAVVIPASTSLRRAEVQQPSSPPAAKPMPMAPADEQLPAKQQATQQLPQPKALVRPAAQPLPSLPAGLPPSLDLPPSPTPVPLPGSPSRK